MSLKSKFIDYLKHKYQSVSTEFNEALLESLISDQMLSNTIISLSSDMLEKIKTEIQLYQNLRTWGETHLAPEYSKYGLRKPKNFGVCNSFDFHVTEDNQLKLIEINTNAAFLALGLEFYQMLGKPTLTDFNETDLIKMFVEDAHKADVDLKQMTITDEGPKEQRLYLEFLVYKALFEKNGIPTQILDIKDLAHSKSSFIYNRYTDFYLTEEKSAFLKQQFNEAKFQLSPNPYEYFLLADKKRMLDWQNQSEITVPESLLKTFDLGKEDPDYIWSIRKNLFFKPKNSFGSKQVYKGTGVSKKTFEEFYGDRMLAQELALPKEVPVTVGTETIPMKYDLRCFSYAGNLQLIVARIYKGQTTNLRTEGGGFAIVQFQ